MIKEPKFVENILTNRDNIKILNILFERPFRIGVETNVSRIDHAISTEYKHAGFTHISGDLKEEPEINFNDPLNIYANIITNKVFDTLEHNYRFIERIHWNYYLQGQEGSGHVDRDVNDYVSILYNMHTTDGGTEILEKFYQDKASQAKVFKSNWRHRGVSTKNDKARTSLNIVVRI